MPYGSRGMLARGGTRIVPVHPTTTAAGSSILGSVGGAVSGFFSSPQFAGSPVGSLVGRVVNLPGNAPQAQAGMGGGRSYRRMNPCNIRALRRAIRRAKAFEKIALKSIRLVSPHRLKGKHRGGFKKARGRSR